MKRNLKIREAYTGQQILTALLILFLVTGSVLACLSLQRLNHETQSSAAGDIGKEDSTYVKKIFPYNRYSNEVLMY